MIRYYKADSDIDANNFLNQLSQKYNIHQTVIGITQDGNEFTIFYDDWES